MPGLLRNKIVAVTGGSSGIGRAIALAAAGEEARKVLILDEVETPKEGGASTADDIRRMGACAQFHCTDVSNKRQVEHHLDSVAGEGGVDLMVCNAGITETADGFDVEEARYRRLMAINVDGALFAAQAAVEQMKARGKGGSIILIGSIGGIVGSGNTVAYSTSKGAIHSMARALADALGPHGIRVNAVCPGPVETSLMQDNPAIAATADALRQRIPLRRFGTPREVANVVIWLGSDLSSYVTGVSLLADGGLLATL